MKCLIIGPGKSNTLRQWDNSKPFEPLLGVPLIERVIRSAMEAGADDFYVVAVMWLPDPWETAFGTS